MDKVLSLVFVAMLSALLSRISFNFDAAPLDGSVAAPPAADATALPAAAPPPVVSAPLGLQAPPEQWACAFYPNRDLAGAPVLAETYAALKLNWRRGAPAPGLPVDGFSMRCESELRLTESGNYQFSASADDAVRVYVNDALLINEWHVRGGAYRADIALGAGPQRVRVEYYDAAGSAAVNVGYTLSYDGWKARYYASATREGDPLLIRNDGTQAMLSVHFDSAGSAAPSTTAAVQWEREIAFEQGVSYQIDTDLDGQALLYVGGDGDVPSYLLGQGRSTLTLPVLSGKRLVQIIYTRPPSGGGHAEVVLRGGNSR